MKPPMVVGILLVAALVSQSALRAQEVPSGLIRLNEAVFIGLQVADLHGTWLAEQDGRVEGNPMMRDGIHRKIALKSAATAGVIVWAELSRRRHPTAVKRTLITLNVLYGTVVARNYVEHWRAHQQLTRP